RWPQAAGTASRVAARNGARGSTRRRRPVARPRPPARSTGAANRPPIAPANRTRRTSVRTTGTRSSSTPWGVVVGGSNDRDPVLAGSSGTVAEADAHAAEAEGGHVETGRAERAFLH